MQPWYPGAVRKPLGPQTEPKMVVPRLFIVHTMSGFLAGSDAWFRRAGYDGTESHFGIGGSWDKGLDGVVWQWQDLGHTADAQAAGNAVATSVETSDGAKSGVPWTAKQIEAIVKLGVWWCQQTGRPARITDSATGVGFGWHAQFKVWNPNAHDCPGKGRLAQYKGEVVPEIALRLKPPAPTAPPWPGRVLLAKTPEMTGPDVLAWQRQMRKRGWTITTDGHYKPADASLCEKFQRDSTAHGWPLEADGKVGKQTWRATFDRPIS